MFRHQLKNSIIILSLLFLFINSCEKKEPDKTPEKLLASTTIIADVVKNICGDRANVESILPPGASPHSFEAVPRDMVKIDQADLIFINGAGLEQFLDRLIDHPELKKKIISLSKNIELLHTDQSAPVEEDNHSKDDPHVWMNPQNVITWANTIEETLCKKDSVNCSYYKLKADVYKAQLKALDIWIADQFKSIDENNRKIITDHRMLGYYASRYGLEQTGAIIPGFSTLAEPSAREIARLEDEIIKLKVKSILIGINVNPVLAERITQDTGTRLIRFYAGSLSEKNGPADTYLKYMRFNTKAIVKALN